VPSSRETTTRARAPMPLPPAPAPLYARPWRRSISCGTELRRQESIHPREGATAGRWWAGDGAAAGRRQARVGAAAGRLQTRGHCASTPLRLAIARRPAGLKRGRWRERWRGGGTHQCAATLAPAGSSPGLRHGRREHRCGLLLLAA
jgi:hypothetical protein